MGSQEVSFIVLLVLALLLRLVHILYLLWRQTSVDVFLVDWEKPKGIMAAENSSAATSSSPDDAATAPVSIWRTYFVANEWNEIQSLRKISPTLCILIVLFLLEVVGLRNLAERGPIAHVTTSPDRYSPPHSSVLRFALTAVLFIACATVMVSI